MLFSSVAVCFSSTICVKDLDAVIWMLVKSCTSLDSRPPSLIKRVLSVHQPRLCSNHHGDFQLVGTFPLGEHRVKMVSYLKHQHKEIESRGSRRNNLLSFQKRKNQCGHYDSGAFTSRCTCFLTTAGSMLGTCLMENLAVTLAGMTVFVPGSEKAPSMPWMVTVG